MNRLKISFIIEALIVVILIIVIPFTQNNDFDNGGMALYLTSKIVLGLVFLSSVCYGLLSKAKTGSATVIVGLGAILQFVPIAMRALAKANFDQKWLVAILILALCIMLFVGLIFGLSYQDKKMIERDKVSEGETIPVVEEKRLATDGEENK